MPNTPSRLRAEALRAIAEANNQKLASIAVETDPAARRAAQARKAKMLAYFGASERNWDDYRWQFSHRIDSAAVLRDLYDLSDARVREIDAVSARYRWSIPPYYLSLADAADPLDPIGLEAIPTILETMPGGEADPMAEAYTNPAPLITRRYPDRLIVNATNVCGAYCRFCQRKRNIGQTDRHCGRAALDAAIAYIENDPAIRDVLITGGDPLTMGNAALEAMLKRIRAIAHVEIIRIGTRIPVTIPQRIDKKLCAMLKRYHPLYLNVHFNHPKEITPEAERALGLLADAGIPLGNQMVLLNGVNNDPYIVMQLNRALLRNRVKPYYIFHAKNVTGTLHFNCSIDDGVRVVDFLRGNTSGMAIPTFIVNAPEGLGKVPVSARSIEDAGDDAPALITWEKRKVPYRSPETVDIRRLYGDFIQKDGE